MSVEPFIIVAAVCAATFWVWHEATVYLDRPRDDEGDES